MRVRIGPKLYCKRTVWIESGVVRDIDHGIPVDCHGGGIGETDGGSDHARLAVHQRCRWVTNSIRRRIAVRGGAKGTGVDENVRRWWRDRFAQTPITERVERA